MSGAREMAGHRIAHDTQSEECKSLWHFRSTFGNCTTRGRDRRAYLHRGGTPDMAAARDGTLERQHGKDICFDERRETREHIERKIGEITSVAFGMTNRVGHRFVRVAKRH